MAFREIGIEELCLNPFTKIGQQWMLITAGDERGCNTMTAAWGGMGFLWRKNVVTVYIRPQRYTKKFVDENQRFTLSFFGEEYRNALKLLGTKSGRDGDKIAEAGLRPFYTDGTAAFEEAELVLVCRKLYHQDMLPECFDEEPVRKTCYPLEDYHTVYVGEIERALVHGE